ncbi:protein-glutamate O-methyltransferase CheR [uncultured Sulfitobacter sp.]|uniref:CheR family methyltransferase n=1 Tax=uncultured Sulfitobacter sp. TaxID=191468 RepID=UPI0025976C35|nr:protein-glutamate O-methyltransferase CheR [uncultured Sulfitobacter sp.]
MSEFSPIKGRSTIESAISDQAFARIAKIALREAGIVLATSKVSMVKSRLTRRLRALGMSSFDDYLDLVETGNDSTELGNFISALTTNVSHFFRENHHFEFLAKTILPSLQQKLAAGGKVRIWSAGCSNGQEPYSIAMTLLNADPSLIKKNIKILATDIDPEVLSQARSAQYKGSLTTGLTDEIIAKHFSRDQQGDEIVMTVNANVRGLVSFRQLNLHAEWPMKGKFDVIFCRNVVIYFDEETQARLYRRYAQVLEAGGWLMLGHSERIIDSVNPLYKNVGVTTYQTISSDTAAIPLEDRNSKGPI